MSDFFSESCALLARVLSDQGDKKRELRQWLHRDNNENKLIYQVAIDRGGNVVGVAITEYVSKMNVAFFYRIAVNEKHRGQGIARLLVKERIYAANLISEKNGKHGIAYAITEIQRPKITKESKEERYMRNIVRLSYHEKVSQFKAIVSPDNWAVGSSKYIFVLNNIKNPNSKFIAAREAMRLLYWYYIDYSGYGESEGGRKAFLEIANRIAWRPKIKWEDVARLKKKIIQFAPKHLMLELLPLTEAAMLDKKVKEYIIKNREKPAD